MSRGRKVQREWSKNRGNLYSFPSAFSDEGPQGAIFEDQKKQIGFRISRNIIRVLFSVIVVFVFFLIGVWYYKKTVVHRPENKIIRSSERYQKKKSYTSSSNIQASKSENKKIGQILKKENSEWVDPSQVRVFSVDEVFELMDVTKKQTLTPSEIIEKYGKAFAGLLDYDSSGKERVTFYYKLSDQQGFFKIIINEFEGKSRVERVYLEVTKAQAGKANKTLEEYRSYLPKSGQEGIGLMEAINQFGIPKNSYSNNLYEGENSYIYILYFTTDQRKITLSFKKNQQGEYRLENVTAFG